MTFGAEHTKVLSRFEELEVIMVLQNAATWREVRYVEFDSGSIFQFIGLSSKN